MILKKKFKYDVSQGFVVDNFNDVRDYINEKVKIFKLYENWVSKDAILDLIKEINNMYDEDITNLDIDETNTHLILYSENYVKENLIQYYDYIYILGTIIYNVFDYDKNALALACDGENGPINMADMVAQGYSQLVLAKKENKNAYGASLIFATIIESELKRKFKYTILEELTNKVEQKIRNNEYTPSEDEKTLIKCLKDEEDAPKYDPIFAKGKGASGLFQFANVYDADSTVAKDQKELIENKTTLNKLLKYSMLESRVNQDFLKMMRLLFGTSNLNLRNDMAHGVLGYRNYYHISATSLLYFVSNIIINDYHLLP